MGYKSVVRSLSASANRANRAAAQASRQKAREYEKKQKKVGKIAEKQARVLDALNDLYAKGKVSEKDYESFKKRVDDVGLELLIFGGNSGLSLAKEYVTGKLDKEEFKSKAAQILPTGLGEEKAEIERLYDEAQAQLKEFQDALKKTPNECGSCSKKKGFLSFFTEVDGFLFCSKCKKTFSELQYFSSYNGHYFRADKSLIQFDQPLQVVIKDEHLLAVK